MADRFDQLAPRDLAITLRSLGRRFGAIESGARDPKVRDRLDAIGPSGRSLNEIVAEAARNAAFLANEVDRGLDHEDPVIPAAALDAGERSFVDDRPLPLPTAVDSLKSDGERAGVRIEKATSSELSREIAVAGGGASPQTTTVHQIGIEMARTSINLLNEAETLLESLR